MMRVAMIFAIFSVFLTSACDTLTLETASTWHTIEPNLVRDWCEKDKIPVRGPDGWPPCSLVTHDDAKRLGGHKTLVEEKRAEN